MLFFAHIFFASDFQFENHVREECRRGTLRIKTLQSTAQSAQVNHGETKRGFYECVRVNAFLSKCSCLYIFVHVFVYFHLCVCELWKDHVGIVVFDECLSDIEILRIVPQQNTALLSHFN